MFTYLASGQLSWLQTKVLILKYGVRIDIFIYTQEMNDEESKRKHGRKRE